MTNTDIILAHIRATPGLTDAELVQRTGVRPHQQVNAICNRLRSRGLIRRAVGSVGAIVNVPVDGSLRPTRPSGPERSPRPPSVSNSSSALSEIARLDPARTLLVIPCSGTKAHGGNRVDGAGLCSALPSAEAHARRRANVSELALVWTNGGSCQHVCATRVPSTKQPAASSAAPSPTAHTRSSLVAGMERCSRMSRSASTTLHFAFSWWPDAVVARSVAAYAHARGLTSVVAFLAKSPDYAKSLRHINWSAQGIAAYLVSPDIGGTRAAQRAVPLALGEVLVAFRRHELREGWRSRSGLALSVEHLP